MCIRDRCRSERWTKQLYLCWLLLSGFRPLPNIPHCCLPQESGPCLSSSLADHPLRPAMDRRLGRPLLYQQPNPTQASPKADKSFNPKTICGISYPFGQLSLTLGQIPTRYSAVRRSPAFCTISSKSSQTLTPLEMMRLISLGNPRVQASS